MTIGVLGDKESLLSFRSAGFEVFRCETRKEALDALSRAAKACGVIYVTEEVYNMVPDEIKEYDEKPLPAIIPVPGTRGSSGLSMELLYDSVEKAVGSNILKVDE